jgi:hypothetical protein
MATIGLSRREGRDDTAETVFHQTHRAVCAARSSRLHQHRGSCVHHGRRTRRMNVTRYRSATSGDTRTSVPLSGKDFRSNHRLLLPVLTMTAGLAVLSVMLLRAFDPATGGRAVRLVVGLIAIFGAVILNALAIEATRPSARPPRRQ